MNYLILFVLCLLFVEIFIRSKYMLLIKSTSKLIKRSIYIIFNQNISDHWKENIIPYYSLQMMKYSLQMLLILSLILFIFVIIDNLFTDFLNFTLSWNGIIESVLITFSYAYIRKLVFK